MATDLVQLNPTVKNLAWLNSPVIRDHFPFPGIRPAQDVALDEITRAYAEHKKFVIIEAPTGSGKCLAKGTRVLMFDGTRRNVEDIHVGELVMGPDSLPRQVLSTSSGMSEMFAVVPHKGETYVVNSEHVLSLRYSGKPPLKSNAKCTNLKYRSHSSYLDENGICDIPIKEYIEKSKNFKHLLKGFKVGVEFSEQDIPLSPYWIGLWLGDGSSAWPSVTTCDKEITAYLENFASSFGLFITQGDVASIGPTGLVTYTWNISSKIRGGHNHNPIVDHMRSLNLLGNKHIPLSYLVNSRKNRLELLAGLIDSDGYGRGAAGYEIWSKWEHLSDQICFLSRSLGFACFVKPGVGHLNGKDFPGFGITIYGKGLEQIPVLLDRKRGSVRKQIKDALHTHIEVKSVGIGEFFGFSLDGDGRFLLGDFTVTHNSGIAMAAASWAKTLQVDHPLTQPGAYILSPVKILTAQYMRDFEINGLLELKGKSNYWCTTHDTDCDSAAIINNASKEGDNRSCCMDCPYKIAKKRFIDNPIGVTNFAFYLNETQYVGQLKNRKMLILDEGHNAESQILGFADTVISRYKTEELGLGRIPTFKPGENLKCKKWLSETFIPTAQQYMTDLTNQIEMARIDSDISYLEGGKNREDLMKLIKKLDTWDKFICRLNRFMASEDMLNWLCFTTEENKRSGTKEELLIKPLTATMFADEILFDKAEMVVIMSATILDFNFFMRNLGINPADAICVRIDSDFPVENRPVYFQKIGSMAARVDKETGKRMRDLTMPKMVLFVEKLLDKYSGKKGIIHTNSYEFAKQVIIHLRSTRHGYRVVTHTSDTGSREAAVLEHAEREDDTVLISPSMTEGLDLNEDLGRFCIVIKVPFLYIDPYVEARMKRDKDWYDYMALLAIVQEFGRVVRSREDKAHGWLLDADFENLLRRSGRMLPRWWVNALIPR